MMDIKAFCVSAGTSCRGGPRPQERSTAGCGLRLTQSIFFFMADLTFARLAMVGPVVPEMKRHKESTTMYRYEQALF